MIGSMLGHHRITARLGEGGMGEVYRATDGRLDREVAIKLLPPAFAADPERLARFDREAKLLAQLHHPNIASVFGLEDADGTPALVMELVEGEDLSARIARGPLPVDEALAIARQIAEALEAAHERGIVHRDLKPQNVKLTPDGTVKVLDFGLAKAMDPAAGRASAADLARSPTLLNSPTVTSAAIAGGTQLGVILGTAAYMAPEQARGGTVDKRADIWAFGVVLFEMLTGRSLFAGETVSDTLAGVLRQDVDWRALPAATPGALRRLLRVCLERNPKNRLHDIADARLTLDELLAGGGEDAAATPAAPAAARRGPLRWLPWGVAAVAAGAAIALALQGGRARSVPDPSIRFHIAPPESVSPTRRGFFFELSPDGRFLAIAVDGGLWVRPLDALAPRRLEGVSGVTYPFWSPDGAWIGFFADGQLKKVPRDGGPVVRLCDAPESRGGAFGPGGVIVFSPDLGNRGLWRVSSQGGEATRVTEVPGNASNHYHRYPQFLPDGRFLFLVLAPDAAVAGVYAGSLDGGAPVRVLDGSERAVYAPGASGAARGHLLFRREQTLMARTFDVAGLRATGDAQAVAEDVGTAANTGMGAFTVAASGMLAFVNDFETNGELFWVDRAGARIETVQGETAELQGLALSPGGGRLAFASGAQPDLWIQPLPGGAPSRFTFGPAPGWASPVWSPDGSELAYATYDIAGMPRYEIRRRRADRGGGEVTLLAADTTFYPWDWSPDGGALVYTDDAGVLNLLPLVGDRTPVRYLESRGQQSSAQFSPDGSLLAYVSDELAQAEVFVGTVPASGAVWQISTAGGTMPRWRRDGRELFFRAADGTLMAVPLGAGSGAAAIEGRGAPQALFAGIPSAGNVPRLTYAAADDGQRFLIAASRSADQPPITVVTHWQNGLASGAVAETP